VYKSKDEGNLALACTSCNKFKGSDLASIDLLSGEILPLTALPVPGSCANGRALVVALQMHRSSIVRIRAMWVLHGEHPPDEN
jgi:hypothetical protein